MKNRKSFYVKILSVLILSSFVCTQSYSQDFLENGGEWSYYMSSFFPDDGDESRFRIDGDTVINGISCKIFKREQINCNLRYTYEEYLYRDDNRIHFYHFEDSLFYQLYNFDLQVGEVDSFRNWEYYENFGDYSYYRVDSITTINFEGQSLQEYHCNYGIIQDNGEIDYNPSFPFSIIEEVGHTFNLFYFYDTGLCDGRHVSRLNCYRDSNDRILEYSDTGCSNITSYNENFLSHSEIKIFPNPVFDNLRIESDHRIHKIELISIVGQRQVIFDGEETQNINLGFEKYSPGIYVLKMYFKDGLRSSRKILVK